ncbi:hypothetical protein HNP24_000884 [Chryseobacterium sediminis]|uniref:LPXTG cell wall anchor domain-containing protein n=1 Tax=Chryseobacterium sediminis TaxID=1679494 RepID=A0ABR6PWH1_9FLAO|nr:hypothetical protein [Chryseobacterium sediminis]MBB6329934.1 hypothetical protein [Chryseobacterium sediminis]
MTKKIGLSILIFLLFALGAYYFFQKETASIYSKSAGADSADKDQGQFIPEQNADYIVVTEYSESWFNIQNITIFILALLVVFLIVRKIRTSRKY